MEHQTHDQHSHIHSEHCGHIAIQHEGHIDYLHHGHLHTAHESHYDEHVIAVSTRNPEMCIQIQCECGHQDCGHEQVPHGNHMDYLCEGRLHHPHGDHCDDHGSITIM